MFTPRSADEGRRIHARLDAHRLVSEVQSRVDAVEDLLRAQREAEEQAWPEVERVLLYAAAVRALWLSGADAAARVADLLTRSEQDGDDPLHAAALAMRAETHLRQGTSALEAERADGDLALAAALLEMPTGQALERVSAFICCASAYAERELWELEAEMYAKAADLLPGCELELPALVVLHNRAFTYLYAACALEEVGQHEDAKVQCRLGMDQVEEALAAGMPEDFEASVRGVRYLLAAIAEDPRPESLDSILEATTPLLHQHSVGSVHLAEALRALRAGDHAAALRAVEVAEPKLAFDPRSTELALALCVAARASAPDAAGAIRYGRHNATLRRHARLRLLAAARARLETERLRMERDAFARHALEDELTGLANRHGYNRWLEERGNAGSGPIAVVIMDVDRFKDVNDVHGHQVGDQVLRRVGRLLAAATRSTDLVARMGGDEFVVLMPDLAEREGLDRALELLHAIRSESWHTLSPALRLTVSCGIAAGSVADAHDLLGRADSALYQAKVTGRDRAVSAGSLTLEVIELDGTA